MEWVELIIAVPITGIIFGCGGSIIRNILESRERQLKLRLRMEARAARLAPRPAQNTSQSSGLEALRAEIAALRDTTTQYDLTNDHIVQRLEERLSRIETRLAARPANPQVEGEVVQRLNTRG